MKSGKSLWGTFVKVVGCVALACCALSVARADDAASAAGTWYWTTPGRNGGADRTNTLTLKVDGSTVTGSISTPGRGGRANKVDISGGTITNNTVTFKTERENNGTTTTVTYSGKVSADAIEGTTKTQRGDADPRTRPWKAMKQTAGS